MNRKIDNSRKKQRIWLFCCLLGVVGLVAGVTIAEYGQPTIETPVNMHDFGLIEPGTVVQYQFPIVNAGRKVLEIKQINVSCGCISDAHLGTSVLRPGQKTNLYVTWESPTYETQVQERVQMYTNDPVNPEEYFTVKAQMKSRFGINPANFSFGIVEKSELPVTETITIKRYGQGNIHDNVKYSMSGDYWDAKLKKNGPEEWELALSLLRNAPIGPLVGNVKVTPSWGSTRTLSITGGGIWFYLRKSKRNLCK